MTDMMAKKTIEQYASETDSKSVFYKALQVVIKVLKQEPGEELPDEEVLSVANQILWLIEALQGRRDK